MVGLFYFLTIYCLLRGAAAVRGSGWYAAALGTCALGMASKEVMVSAPVVALLYDRIFIAGSFRKSLRRRRGLWLALASTWVLLALLVYSSHNRAGSAGFGLGITVWEYARTQFGCIIHYLRLAFWPSPLVLDYGAPVARTAAEIVPYAIAVFVLLAATVAVLALRPKLGFLGVWFFAILAPTSSIVPLPGQTEAEHRMYLPLAAVIALVTLCGFELGRRIPSAWHPARRTIGWGATGVLVLMLAILTVRRNAVYGSELALWRDTVERCPSNPRAHYALAMACGRAGRIGEAIGQYQQALRIKSDYIEARYNLGMTLQQAGRTPEAKERYDETLQLKPDYADAHNNLGNILLQEGKITEAIDHYERALQIKPDYAEAQYNLGLALARQGRLPEAVIHFEQALRFKPDYAEAHWALGMASEQAGKARKAIGHYQQALRIKPDFTQAQDALARLQASQ